MNDFDLGGISFVYINKNIILKFLGIFGVRIFKHLYLNLNFNPPLVFVLSSFLSLLLSLLSPPPFKKKKKKLRQSWNTTLGSHKVGGPTMELTHFVQSRSNVLRLPKYCPPFNNHYNHFYYHHYYHQSLLTPNAATTIIITARNIYMITQPLSLMLSILFIRGLSFLNWTFMWFKNTLINEEQFLLKIWL